ncbi:MAG: NAD(P)-dependent oxidoreductase [Gammaproteobacteria bacterium]
MKILLTGATGFIGRPLLNRLLEKFGSESIMVISSKQIAGVQCAIYKSHRDLNLERYDFTDVTVLIHAGAFTQKSSSDLDAIDKCNDNILFTEQLFRLSMPNLKKVIYLSTIDVYEECDVVSERSNLRPATLYGASKLYCEQMSRAFARNKQIESLVLRIGHVYGPGEEKYKKMLPQTIQKVIAGEQIEIWGDGSELRSFIYIDDVVRAIASAIGATTGVGEINIVSSTPITISELVREIVGLGSKRVQVIFQDVIYTKRNWVFDNSLMRQHLLSSEIGLDEGLRREFDYMERLVERNI